MAWCLISCRKMFLSPRHVDLVTLRLHVPKSFVSVERWKACKERPVEGAKEWLGKVKCHSVYGWREHTQKSWKGKEENFLCGYMKTRFCDPMSLGWTKMGNRTLLTTMLCVKLPRTSLVRLLSCWRRQ